MLQIQNFTGEGSSFPIRLRALSLGAGVQSTTMALMAAHSEIGPMPDCAIFADTGWEPKAVYEYLEWLMSPNVLPFPVHIVSAGNIRDNLMDAAAGKRWGSIPAFAKTVTPAGTERAVLDEDDEGELVEIGSRATLRDTVSVGMMRRACTTDFNIVPIRRKVRQLLGLTRKHSPDHAVAEQWIGISTDEATRMKPSFEDWQMNRWPLIEQRRAGAIASPGCADMNIRRPRSPPASDARFTTTAVGVTCAIMIPKPGQTR